MIKHLPTTLIKLTAFMLLLAPFTAKSQCTGFTFSIENVTVTSFTTNTIYYNYTIRNTGTTTVSTDNLLLQNYVTTDQTGAGAQAAGGSFISGSTNIAPNATYTGSFQAGHTNSPSIHFLKVELHYAVLSTCQVTLTHAYECLSPDAQFVSFTINNTQAASITYQFDVKNVGADTLFLNQLLLENFLSTNSTYDGSDVAAGSGQVTISGKTYLLANETGTATFTTSGSNSGYSFLVTKLTYSEQTECSTGNNEAIEPIPAIEGLFSSQAKEADFIHWNSELKSFTVNNWTTNNTSNLNYEIYNATGVLQSSGNTSVGESTRITTKQGIYILTISDGVNKYSKKIAY